MSDENMGSSLPPFKPPGNAKIADKKAKAEAEAAKKDGKPAPMDVADGKEFVVQHEMVGPWPKGQRLTRGEVYKITGDEPEHLDRLIDTGALKAV